jgi:MFS family permease
MVRKIALAYRDAYAGLSNEVWVLSIALLINRCGSMVLAFLTLYLTQRLGFTGGYLGGRLVQPLGAVRVQILGLALSVPCYLLMPTLTSWTGVAIGMFFLSLFVDGVRPASGVAIAQFTDPKLQTRAYGLQRMAGNLGFSIGPAIGGVLAEIDFAWLFIVDGISTGVGSLFLIWFFGFRRYAKGDGAAKKQRQAEQQTSSSGSPLLDGHFLCFLFLILSVAIVFFQFHATYPKYLADEYALTKPQIGLMFSLNTAIIVVFEMLLVNYVSRYSLLRAIGWGCCFACLGFGMLPASHATWFAVLSMVVITVGEMFMFPLASGFVAARSNGRNQGMYMSWYVMMYSLAGVIAPLIGTAVYERGHNLIWYASLGVGIFVLVGLTWLAKKVESVASIEADPALARDC